MRRLGVGSSGSGDRPLKAQVIVALVCVLMLIAVPLYLMRKPSTKAGAAAPAASASTGPAAQAASKPSAGPTPAAPAAPPRLTLGPVQKVRCGSSPSAAQNEGSLCDSLGPFEEALKKAIVETEQCAPKGKLPGTINYVLTVDFPRKKLHVYPGKSGEWRGKQARRATNCVKNAVKAPDWNMPHQYRFYALAILATYAGAPGSTPIPPASGQPALPNFE